MNLDIVRKPARYIGKEWNLACKNVANSKVKIALCYPDMYELGMSNLGFRILYGLLNKQRAVFCDRVFAPADDYLNYLKEHDIKLSGLDSRIPLSKFDIIGFSLGYELTFTNVLSILSFAGLPLRSRERIDKHPLVIAGGPCVVNPEPMSEFIDAFVIGESEEAIIELINCFKKTSPRNELLKKLSRIEGVYVPSLYDVNYKEDFSINEIIPNEKGVPSSINKRIVKEFDRSFFPVDWLVPFIQVVHDRISLEIMRGCPNSCRFCQARNIYYPYRIRKLNTILKYAKQTLKRTGYEELGLCGLSVSDHYQIRAMIKKLTSLLKGRGISLSLSSMRADILLEGAFGDISSIKKTGLTFALEAGSSRLQKKINKNIDMDKFFFLASQSLEKGWRKIKLYFMVGFPDETEDDLAEIILIVDKLLKLRSSSGNKFLKINLSVNPFIPKPHTPFQWVNMESIENLKRKKYYLLDRLNSFPGNRINFSFHNIESSFLEAVLSRGDRRLSEVISIAWNKGAKFDAWSEFFDFKIWQQAFKEANLDPNFFVNRNIALSEKLPWDHIKISPEKAYLFKEFEQSQKY